MHFRSAAFLCLTLLIPAPAFADEAVSVSAVKDLAYRSDDPADYVQERCKLDLYLPPNAKGFPTLVWFHGGGLTGGSKEGKDTIKVAQSLTSSGIAVAVPSYRLSPKVNFPAYVEDAAAAFAWVQKNIAGYGGDVKRLYIGGHSAGGYLAAMLGMDERYLAQQGLKLTDVAGFIPVSGQTLTHYTVRQERGQAKYAITADEAAPIHFARKDTMPFLVLYADHDMETRMEDNAYFVSVLKAAGSTNVTGVLIKDRTHNTIANRIAEANDPARQALVDFIMTVPAPAPASATSPQ